MKSHPESGYRSPAVLHATCRHLTNLNYESLKETLGMRILDRLQMDGGMWVNFEWDSYRKNVRHLRVVK